MREDAISSAIKRMSGSSFERFARELATRELYPGLNPTSDGYDLGEDARTELTTIFVHDELWVSLVISKTGTITKLRDDCERCEETGRRVDVISFVTAGNPRSDTIERWQTEVKRRFGWDLEVWALRWIAPTASRPDHESLVDDYLGIPPPGGDFIESIEREFSGHTEKALNQVSLRIPGISYSLPRDEVGRVEDQLSMGKPVILVGEAGTGKSGISALLAKSAIGQEKVVLLLDARSVGHVRSETELRQHLALNGSLASAVQRVGRHRGCRLIIDQLDNIAGSRAAALLVETMSELHAYEGTEVIVVSRGREGHEAKLLKHLVDAGYVELVSHPLNEDKATQVLLDLDIQDPSPELITLGSNLLNLELIGRIKQDQPTFDFSTLMDEIDLWEQYVAVLLERESIGSQLYIAEEIIAEAVKLAHLGLNNEDRSFCLEIALPYAHQRLISWGIIVCESGLVYRFRHEKLQDFLYAWNAAQQRQMPGDVLRDINIHRTRNILTWMDRIYSRQNPRSHRQFLRETLNVQQ